MKHCAKPTCQQINPQNSTEFYKGRNSCKTCHKEVMRSETSKLTRISWRRANQNQVKGHWLRKYWPELSWKEALIVFNQLLVSQNNLCAICEKPEAALDGKTGLVRDLSVDHCHKTNKVRGLLCSSCNRALGYFKDDFKLCQSGAEYLKSHEQT